MNNESNARRILATNIINMIKAETPPGARMSLRAWAMSKDLDVRLIDRLSKGTHSVTLDNIEKVAQGCGIRAWQLLYDGSALESSPAAITAEERKMLNTLKRLLAQ